jgi:hypothetical protein
MREETRNEIRIMREFNELQVRETDKKIDASKELAKESIKASEARIDTILLKFMVQYKKNDNEMK